VSVVLRKHKCAARWDDPCTTPRQRSRSGVGGHSWLAMRAAEQNNSPSSVPLSHPSLVRPSSVSLSSLSSVSPSGPSLHARLPLRRGGSEGGWRGGGGAPASPLWCRPPPHVAAARGDARTGNGDPPSPPSTAPLPCPSCISHQIWSPMVDRRWI
jgi:hypothetical protein